MKDFTKNLNVHNFTAMSDKDLNIYLEENKESIIEMLSEVDNESGEDVYHSMNLTDFRQLLNGIKEIKNM